MCKYWEISNDLDDKVTKSDKNRFPPPTYIKTTSFQHIYTSYTQTTAQNWKTGKLFAVCLARIKTRLLGTQMRLWENILHPITNPPYRTEAPSSLRLAADTFKLHNMWIIAMFYQGIKQVWRKLCTSCTSQVSWQNACINSGLVNTVKTSAPIKHFYEVKGRINRFCTAAPRMCVVSFL